MSQVNVAIAILFFFNSAACVLLGAWIYHRASKNISPMPTIPMFAQRAEVTGGESDNGAEANKTVTPERKPL